MCLFNKIHYSLNFVYFGEGEEISLLQILQTFLPTTMLLPEGEGFFDIRVFLMSPQNAKLLLMSCAYPTWDLIPPLALAWKTLQSCFPQEVCYLQLYLVNISQQKLFQWKLTMGLCSPSVACAEQGARLQQAAINWAQLLTPPLGPQQYLQVTRLPLRGTLQIHKLQPRGASVTTAGHFTASVT